MRRRQQLLLLVVVVVERGHGKKAGTGEAIADFSPTPAFFPPPPNPSRPGSSFGKSLRQPVGSPQAYRPPARLFRLGLAMARPPLSLPVRPGNQCRPPTSSTCQWSLAVQWRRCGAADLSCSFRLANDYLRGGEPAVVAVEIQASARGCAGIGVGSSLVGQLVWPLALRLSPPFMRPPIEPGSP